MSLEQQAILIKQIGKPVELGTRVVPRPNHGEVLVKITAAMILPHDSYSRDLGLFVTQAKLPFVPAANVAGTVAICGADVEDFSEGERVFGFTIFSDDLLSSDHGGLQQFAILKADALAKTPTVFPDEQVVTLPTNLVTSWQTLFTPFGFDIAPPLDKIGKAYDNSSSSVVVLAAGSNIGKFALQIAHIAGVGTIVAVAGASNKKQILDMGATHFFDRSMPLDDIVSGVHAVVGVDGVRFVYDCYNADLTLARALLSTRSPSILRSTQPISEEQLALLKALKPLCDAQQIHGSNERLKPYSKDFWEAVPIWLQRERILPTRYRVINGLDKVSEINGALDSYRDGKGGKQWVVKVTD